MPDDRSPSNSTADGALATASALGVMREGVRTTPELLDGLRVTAGLGVVAAVGQITAPIVIQQAIERGGLTSGTVDIGIVWRLVLIGGAVVLGTGVIALVARRQMIRRSESALRSLRLQVFDHVHRMSLSQHNEQPTGVLISRVTSDVDSLSRFADWGMFVWLVEPFVVLGVFLAIAWYSWPLALVALLTFLPAVLSLRWMRDQMMRAHDLRRTAIGDLLGEYNEALAGAEVIRAYAAQPLVEDRLRRASHRRYRAGLRANLYMSSVYVIGDLVGAVMLAVVMVVGVTQRDALGLSGSELVAVLFLTTLLHTPIAELGETLNQSQEAVAGWRKVLGLLATPVTPLDPAEGAPLPSGALAIEADTVSFDYGDGIPVLREVSLSVPAGTRVAVIGETGSGKSTFARLLCRLADPTDGRVLLGGVDLAVAAAGSRQATVRMVPQDGFLFDVSVGENISYGRPGCDEADVLRAIDMLGLGPWLATLPNGLETRVGERGQSLSVGERQLVSFARAAVADPGLLILDEATSSVDPQTDVMLTKALERLSEGRTLVSIAHRLSTAEASDLVLVFEQGRLAESGSHDELLAAGGLYTRQHAAWTTATT